MRFSLLCLALLACGGPSAKERTEPKPTGPDLFAVTAATSARSQTVRRLKLGGNRVANSAEIVEALLPGLPALLSDCRAANRVACWLFEHDYQLVTSLLLHEDVLHDNAKAICKTGNVVACEALAQSHDNPSGVGGEPETAMRELMRICSDDRLDPCVRAATIRIGSGIEVPFLSEGAAKGFLRRGCDQGFPLACRLQVMFVGALPIEDRNNFDQAVALPVYRRACDVGAGCPFVVEAFRPDEPFGCSSCNDRSMDDRCRDCGIIACRKHHCGPNGANPNHACCISEAASTPVHPEVAPKLSRLDAERLLRGADTTVEQGLALLHSGCEQGHQAMCAEARAVERALQDLSTYLDRISE